MNCIGTYDGTIFYNPANKFCIVSVKTADQSVPAEARSNRRYKDHLIRFTAVGYEIPRTDAVELELDGEWTKCRLKGILTTIRKVTAVAAAIRWYSKHMAGRGTCRQKNILLT